MDSQRRKQLEQKRLELQEIILLRERRECIQAQINFLDAHAIPYEVLYDTAPHYDWIHRYFKTTLGRIDWANVSEYLILPIADDVSSKEWLLQLARELPSEEEVIILWSNAHNPALHINFNDLITYHEIISTDFEVWVFCPTNDWLLEFTFDFGWSWGRALHDVQKQ